jgi:hypothetical protein
VVIWLAIGTWSQAIVAVAVVTALKGTVTLATGTALTSPFQKISRMEAAEVVVCLILVRILSLKFVTHSARRSEKLALVLLVFAICANMLWVPRTP